MSSSSDASSIKNEIAINRAGILPQKPKVLGRVFAIESLMSSQVERMFQLMQLYYDNVTFEQFQADLLEKNHVILLQDKNDQSIQGFSTLLQVPTTIRGKEVIGVYSGDTVLNKAYWGTSALGVTFLKYLWLLKVKNFNKPIYWYLISKGYKTYLLMANNFETHYPRYEMATPTYYKELMNQFYAVKFKEMYVADKDLIKFTQPSCQLREHVAPIKENLLKFPRVQFFQDKNPNWQNGDELTCVAEMTLMMPFAYAIKKFFKGIVK